DEIPIVQEFKQSQIEVNNLLQLVSSAISNKVTDEILISTGGDLLTGETGSQLKNNPSSCQYIIKTTSVNWWFVLRLKASLTGLGLKGPLNGFPLCTTSTR